MKWAIPLLLPVLALSQILLVYGVGEEGPILKVSTIFRSDYENLFALARFDLNFKMRGGDLSVEAPVRRAVEYFALDLESVQLSYGYSRPSFPFPDRLNPEDWLLKIGDGYIVFSKRPRVFVKNGPFSFGAGEDLGFFAAEIDLKSFGIGGGIRNGDWIFLLKVEDLILEFYGFFSPRIYLYRSDVVVSFDGEKFEIFLLGKDGYMKINRDGTEFIERVGSVYAVGEFSKWRRRIGIGIRF